MLRGDKNAPLGKRGEWVRVLMLGWEFPPYFAGGVGIVCHALTRSLARRNHQITYVMPMGPTDVHADFVNLLVADNIMPGTLRIDSLLTAYTGFDDYASKYNRFLAMHDGRTGSLYGRDLLAEIERFAQKLLLLVRELGLDFQVIHAHDWTTFPAAMALKLATGRPMVVHVHITEFDKTGGHHADPRVYAIEKAGMDAADRVIVVSNLIRERCIHQYFVDPAKIRVIHNGVSVEHQLMIERFNLKREDKVVLFLGRVTLQKGPDYFIEAARRVLEIDQNVKFIMAGAGDMLPRMIERAAEIGIGSKVIFPGFVSREEAEILFRMADVFVMPSVSEPFGIVPLEALSYGTPVIISKQSGVSEILRHALKVDFWDVNDIANKIVASLHYASLNSELRHQGGLEVRGMTWESAAAKVESVYHEVAGW